MINIENKELIDSGEFKNIYTKNDKFKELNKEFIRMSNKYSISSSVKNSFISEKISFDYSINGYYHVSNKNNDLNKRNNLGSIVNSVINDLDMDDNKNNKKILSMDQSRISLETNDNYIYEVEEIYKDGSKFKGEILNKKKNGKGKLITKDNQTFEGEWVNDKITGFGILKNYKNEKIYKGNFLNNQYDGLGTLYNLKQDNQMLHKNYYYNWDNINYRKYKGLFQNNIKHGIGYIYFSNNDKLLCEFKNNELNGLGILFFNNNTKLFGQWENNKLIKKH